MPQGKLITTIEDSTIKIQGDDKHALRAFSWSDDSRLVATGRETGTAQVWEVWQYTIYNVLVPPQGFEPRTNRL
jgi:hypothetical protein